MENFKFKTIEEIKPHLRHGDFVLIAEMLIGKYKLATIRAQLNGERTLKAPVLKAANSLIENRSFFVENFHKSYKDEK